MCRFEGRYALLCLATRSVFFRIYYVGGTDLAGHCDAQIKQCVPVCCYTSFCSGARCVHQFRKPLYKREDHGPHCSPAEAQAASLHCACVTGWAPPRSCFGWWAVKHITHLFSIPMLTCRYAFFSMNRRSNFTFV